MLSLIFLFLFYGAIAATPIERNNTLKNVPCSHPTYTFQNSQYFIEPILLGDWYQAHQYCSYINMELVSIETVEENQFLFSTVAGIAGVFQYNFWTSGTLLSNRGWVWMSTGKNVIYAPWADGATMDKKCLSAKYLYTADTLYWRDEDCPTQNYVICEKRL